VTSAVLLCQELYSWPPFYCELNALSRPSAVQLLNDPGCGGVVHEWHQILDTQQITDYNSMLRVQQ
jgi:hypothetical protein